MRKNISTHLYSVNKVHEGQNSQNGEWNRTASHSPAAEWILVPSKVAKLRKSYL